MAFAGHDFAWDGAKKNYAMHSATTIDRIGCFSKRGASGAIDEKSAFLFARGNANVLLHGWGIACIFVLSGWILLLSKHVLWHI